MLMLETCLEIVTNILRGSSRIKTPVTEFFKCVFGLAEFGYVSKTVA